MMRRLFNRRGQSTLEYLLILTGIIAALLIFKGTVQTKVNTALDKAGDTIEGASSTALDHLKIGGAWK